MRIEMIKRYSLAIALLTLLNGCSNALYFYETEKVSLTVEARPDSSQPVQGSLGIKQRVVLIAPKKSNEVDVSKKGSGGDVAETVVKKDGKDDTPEKNDDKNDAVSAISSFNFKIIPTKIFEFSPVMIQTAFITGDAAAGLEPYQAVDAARAIALGDVHAPGADISIISNVVDWLKQRHTDEDNKQLNLLDGLGKAVMPKNYPVQILVSDSKGTIKPKTENLALDTKSPGIASALVYWGEINDSARLLEFALKTPNKYKFDGVPVTNEMVKNGLKNEYEKTEKELKRIGQELRRDSIYTNALQYYIN